MVIRVTKEVDATDAAQIANLLELVDNATQLGLPVAVSGSIPCTGGSQLQQVNIARFGVTEKLREHWRVFRQLWRALEIIARRVMRSHGLVAIEWPLRCAYWRDGRVLRFLGRAPFSKAVVAACMHGMRPQKAHAPDEFIGKEWRVSANCDEFVAALDLRCDGQHRHIVTEGGETSASAFYPLPFVEAIHRQLAAWALRRRTSTT